MGFDLKFCSVCGFDLKFCVCGGDKRYVPIIGRVLESALVSPDGTLLRLVFEDGVEYYTAEGGWHSNTWIAHLEVPSDLIEGGCVFRVDESDVSECAVEGETNQALIKHYRTSIVTARGIVDIKYCNDFGGFYGGWLAYLSKNDKDLPEPLLSELGWLDRGGVNG